MAWDHTNQFQTQDRHSQIEYGTLTLGATGTVECYTYLSAIHSAKATHKAAESGNVLAASTIMCDCTITTNAVTFSDSAGAVNASATITYELRGVA
ncbi:hypothetical protein LCGC14_0297410 [marine sediment metagenome]|uniref:Uncharacterized protein n=1 Tax=marine sediment metagenome TaxID=412755 RepID=A0A0F9WWX9_9ZZZZ